MGEIVSFAGTPLVGTFVVAADVGDAVADGAVADGREVGVGRDVGREARTKVEVGPAITAIADERGGRLSIQIPMPINRIPSAMATSAAHPAMFDLVDVLFILIPWQTRMTRAKGIIPCA